MNIKRILKIIKVLFCIILGFPFLAFSKNKTTETQISSAVFTKPAKDYSITLPDSIEIYSLEPIWKQKKLQKLKISYAITLKNQTRKKSKDISADTIVKLYKEKNESKANIKIYSKKHMYFSNEDTDEKIYFNDFPEFVKKQKAENKDTDGWTLTSTNLGIFMSLPVFFNSKNEITAINKPAVYIFAEITKENEEPKTVYYTSNKYFK